MIKNVWTSIFILATKGLYIMDIMTQPAIRNKTTIFQLIKYSFFDEVLHISPNDSSLRIHCCKFGLNSTFDKAQKQMFEDITDEIEVFSDTIGYSIQELYIDPTDSFYYIASVTNFDAKGNLIEHKENDCEKAQEFHFKGRSKEDIYFHEGDLAISILYEEVCIVAATPPSTEFCQQHDYLIDDTDDCYLTYSLGEGDTHNHPSAATLFPLCRELPDGAKDLFINKLNGIHKL